MQTVLVVSPDDLRPDLAKTVLGQTDVELVLAKDSEAGIEAVRTRRPRLAIVALGDQDATESFVRRIREDKITRNVGLVVMLPWVLPAGEESLRRAGASAVLGGRVDAFLWNGPLERLLHAPPRRETTLPVRFWVWFRFSHEEKPTRGLALNVSVKGMLLEAEQPVEVESGARVEIEFELPGREQTLNVIGSVVRDAGERAGRRRFGIDFLNMPSSMREKIEAFVEAESDAPLSDRGRPDRSHGLEP